MEVKQQNRIQEIGKLLENEDLGRAGIRMMDLVYDLNYPIETRGMATDLRKRYNQQKELGQNKINNPDLNRDFQAFFETLSGLPAGTYEPKTGKIGKATAISKEFRSSLRIFKLNPLDVELDRGTIVGVVGENGNGKTTLLRMIAGDLASDTGKIEYYFNGEPETSWMLNKLRISFIPQRTDKWSGQVFENISFMAAIKGTRGSENRERTEFVLHRMGLTNFAEHTWPQLSSGYRLRFEIARALVWEPAVLILDEPLANLDLQAQEQMLSDLRNLADSPRNPVSMLISSQQLHEVEAISDRIIFLKNGRAVFNGNLTDFRSQQSTRTFEINGKLDYQTLAGVFKDWHDIKIEQTVSAFILTCPFTYTQQDLFKKIVDNQLEIEYLRDITGSTKQLFNDKY